MGSSSSDKKRCIASPTCWLLTFTASVVVNVIFAAVCYVAIGNLQNDMIHVKEHLSEASDMKHEMSDILSEYVANREKRSASSPPLSRLAVDVGSLFLTAIKGMCKPEGAVCIAGAKGEAGNPGRDGLPGRDGIGLPGRDGLPGTTGRDGPVGLRGPPGKPGAKGMGLPGKQGPIGIPGVKGDKGDRGEKGVKGHIGGQGIQGVKGVEGEKGERGERGMPGEKGMRGEKGNEGIQGAKGNEGIQGEKGEIGKLDLLLPSHCKETNYRVLSETWRKVSSHNRNFGVHCDTQERDGFQPGWHVFSAAIGGQMPNSCPPIKRCGTYVPGWLNGSHPTVVGQTSNQTVCFRLRTCCEWQVSVEITNCGGFYVYNLPKLPRGCSVAYCSNA